jgi:glycopeptide antibiotics resistance protein
MLAWLAVVVIVAWLLSMTLRTINQVSVGRIRMSDPASELNLKPFSNKIRPLRNLVRSQNPPTRKAAWTYLFVDVLGNVAVFIPLGAALGVAVLPRRKTRSPGRPRRRFWPWFAGVTGAGLLLSLFIEIAQLAIPSRVSDVDDVILNTLGTALGALVTWSVVWVADRL